MMIVIRSCFSSEPKPVIIGERQRTKRDVQQQIHSVPPQRIDTVTVAKYLWRTRTEKEVVFIHDTIGYVAVSDTIKGKKGTEFIVEYDTYLKNFSVPYLLERPDTTTIITDSIIVEKTVKEESSFWGDVGKLAGGFFGGCLFTTVLK